MYVRPVHKWRILKIGFASFVLEQLLQGSLQRRAIRTLVCYWAEEGRLKVLTLAWSPAGMGIFSTLCVKGSSFVSAGAYFDFDLVEPMANRIREGADGP